MKKIRKHITTNLIAGLVAILPVAGLILTIGYLEATISGSGLSKMSFYFPGLGLIAVIVLIYLIGLALTTFIGRWIWTSLDEVLDKLPALGPLYQTLKQILGYGKGEDAIFHETVLVPGRETGSEELGLVTNRISDAAGNIKLVIFVPGVPNPTSGRLIIMDRDSVRPVSMPVNETLKALVSMGKTEIDLGRAVRQKSETTPAGN
jgi:uncharacterized membrane protein